MSNFPFKHPVTRRTLTTDDLQETLRSFEDRWAEDSGERLTSAIFFDRYRCGEFDSMLGMAWATYYEAFRRMSRADVDADIVRTLAAAG